MSKRKKILLWLGGCLGGLLVLLFASILLVPRLINLDQIRQKAIAGISEKVGGEVNFDRLRLSIFPLPHVEIQQASLSIPEKLSGKLESVSVYPKILPLLKGQLEITEVQVEAPKFRIRLPAKVKKRAENEVPSASYALPTIVAQILVPLVLEAPSLKQTPLLIPRH
jgi:uncharacterized protein involved in outer membrane biogenesis